MSRFLSAAEKESKQIDRTLEPLDLDGGRPVPSLLTKSLEFIENFIEKGPAFTLSDVVSTLLEAYLSNSYVLRARIRRCSQELVYSWA